MNRRTLAWVSVAVLLIIAGAWWLSSGVEEALRPSPLAQAPVPAEQTAPQQLPAIPAPAVAAPPSRAESVDAGALAEVEIEVFDDGVRQVGLRVELDGPGGPTGRPLDIMGVARFTLREGAWRVTSPERRNVAPLGYDGGSYSDFVAANELARATPFEVRAPFTRLRLELPPRRIVRGRVLDTKGESVAGAEVTFGLFERDRRPGKVRTGPFGEFLFEAAGETVLLQASRGGWSSRPKQVAAPGSVTLSIEPWTRLRISVIGPGTEAAWVRVLQSGEFVAEGSSEQWLSVPIGRLDVVARRNARGRVYSGKTSIVTKEKETSADVGLSPSPPLSGRVFDAEGRPVAGLTVEASELDRGAIELFADGGVFLRATSGASTVTSQVGEFRLSPPLRCCADPLYVLQVTGLWRTVHHVLVRIDDAPLEVLVEPVPQ